MSTMAPARRLIQRRVRCEVCEGTGYQPAPTPSKPYRTEPCRSCPGTGYRITITEEAS